MANKRRLIDSAELISMLPIVEEDKQISLIGAVADVVTMISDRQFVDAVEVVRCEKCVYGVESDGDKGMWQCVKDAEYDEGTGMYFGFNSWHDADFYCAYGERRCE